MLQPLAGTGSSLQVDRQDIDVLHLYFYTDCHSGVGDDRDFFRFSSAARLEFPGIPQKTLIEKLRQILAYGRKAQTEGQNEVLFGNLIIFVDVTVHLIAVDQLQIRCCCSNSFHLIHVSLQTMIPKIVL